MRSRQAKRPNCRPLRVADMITAKITERGYALAITGMEKLPRRVLDAAAVGLDRGLRLTVAEVQTNFLKGPRPVRLAAVSLPFPIT